MNDDDVIERVRSGVERVVQRVGVEPPVLDPYVAGPVRPGGRRWWWAVPAAVAAAAALVVGPVSRDGRDDVDLASSPTVVVPPEAPLERWVLDGPGAELVGAEQATTSATAIGTSVYYAAADFRHAAAVRTSGASAMLTRSSWPAVEPVAAQGVEGTRYADERRELVVLPTEPPLTVETYGPAGDRWDAATLATGAVLVEGVWRLPPGQESSAVLGVRAPGSALTYSTLSYRVDGRDVLLTVLAHPGGVPGYLLDAGWVPGELVSAPEGLALVSVGATDEFVVNRIPGQVVSVTGTDPSNVRLRRVDDAEWAALVGHVRPDLVTGSTVPAPTDTAPRYRAIGTVIEVPGESVELCLGVVEESLPPRCDGVPVDPVAWRWPEGTFDQSADGTRWAEYYVEGTFDGTSFTPTADPRVPTAEDRALFPELPVDFTTPCPAPEGGWLAAAAGAPAGEAGRLALEQLSSVAAVEADFVTMWIDRTIDPTVGSARPGGPPESEDLTKAVVNLTFTGDVERHRTDLTPLWSGALCVSHSAGAPRSQLELAQARLAGRTDGLLLSSSIDETRGVVVARYVLVTPTLQAELDAQFGTGVVVAVSALQPLRG